MLQKCYTILNLTPNCDQDQLRSSFLKLVKKYHPDSGSPDADANKFQEIESAYRKLQNKFSKDRWEASKVGGEYGLYYTEKSPKSSEAIREFDIKVSL